VWRRLGGAAPNTANKELPAAPDGQQLAACVAKVRRKRRSCLWIEAEGRGVDEGGGGGVDGAASAAVLPLKRIGGAQRGA
jgi:hypothetical protein